MPKATQQETTQDQQAPKATRRRKTATVAPETQTPEALQTPATPAPAKPTSKTPYAVRRNGTLSAYGLPCLCGCGAATHTPEARFLSGHDAKLRRNVLVFGQPLPEVVVPFFAHGETLAGLALVDGVVVDTKAGSVEEAVDAAYAARAEG